MIKYITLFVKGAVECTLINRVLKIFGINFEISARHKNVAVCTDMALYSLFWKLNLILEIYLFAPFEVVRKLLSGNLLNYGQMYVIYKCKCHLLRAFRGAGAQTHTHVTVSIREPK